jgi:hypothetical protein
MRPNTRLRATAKEIEMRFCLLLASIATLFALAPRASAEIKFVCRAGAPDECAFSVTPADGGYVTNFVIAANQTHGVNDGFAGGKYCVVVSKPHAQVKDWPPTCTNAVTGAPGKVGEKIKAGATYE